MVNTTPQIANGVSDHRGGPSRPLPAAPLSACLAGSSLATAADTPALELFVKRESSKTPSHGAPVYSTKRLAGHAKRRETSFKFRIEKEGGKLETSFYEAPFYIVRNGVDNAKLSNDWAVSTIVQSHVEQAA